MHIVIKNQLYILDYLVLKRNLHQWVSISFNCYYWLEQIYLKNITDCFTLAIGHSGQNFFRQAEQTSNL